MKSKFLFPMILLAGLMIVNFSAGPAFGQTPQNKVVKLQTVKYTCAMHPEVVKDLPGNCPKCGEKLIEKKDFPVIAAPKAHEPVMEKKATQVPDTTSAKQEPMKL